MSQPPYSAIRAAVLIHRCFVSLHRIEADHYVVTLSGEREVGIHGETPRQAIKNAHEYLQEQEQ